MIWPSFLATKLVGPFFGEIFQKTFKLSSGIGNKEKSGLSRKCFSDTSVISLSNSFRSFEHISKACILNLFWYALNNKFLLLSGARTIIHVDVKKFFRVFKREPKFKDK